MPVLLRFSRCAAALIAVLTLGSPAAAQIRSDAGAPTFNRDLAPIVFSRCSTCHRPGGSAPFALLTYEDVRARARQIVTAVTARSMPPWLATTEAGTFAGDRRLSDADVAVFQEWLQRGALQGDAADLPPVPVWHEGWTLGSPDLVLRLESPYRLAPDGGDRLRNVVLPVPVTAARFVRAWELRVTSPAVHHATLVVDSGGAARRLDADDPAPGYEGLIPLSAQSPDGYFLGWTPGQTPYDAGTDIAWRLEPRKRPCRDAAPASDRRLGIGRHQRRAVLQRSRADHRAGHDADEPPGHRDSGRSQRLSRDRSLRAAGRRRPDAIQPHAHYLAREIRGTAQMADGTVKTLLHIRKWDFHWQDVYRFEQPVRLPAGTQVTMDIAFDNSAENRANPSYPPRRVTFGQRSDDEMADMWMQVVPAVSADRERLVTGLRRKLLPQNIDGYRSMIAADPANVSLHDDLALLGIEAGDLPLAIAEFQQSLRLRPAAATSHYNVGNALLLARRAEEAAHYFRDALRLDPAYGLAHQGLGLALAATGALDDGVAALERAVRLMPASPDALYNLGVLRQAQGREDDALAAYVGVLRLTPAHGDAAYAAGVIHLGRSNARDAAEFFRQALAARPGWSPALTELAWALAVADGDVRRPKEALELARLATRSAGRPDARVSEVLAAALAANGLYEEAVTAASDALRLLPDGSDPRQRASMERRLALYRQGKPFYADRR